MGLLKKLTKPLSKFLDKIVPNELKPALPYLAAFAPFMLGPGVGAGSSQGLMALLRRGALTGGINLASQLSQEGSEGEFDPLSLALAGGMGALTSAEAPGVFRGMQRGTTLPGTTDTGIMSSIKHGIGKGGETASNWLQTQGDILRPGGEELTMKNALTAASVPATTGTADLARITAEQALRDFENAAEESGDPLGVTDEGRRRAIRSAMEAGGHAEEAILDALASLGLRSGGIVSLRDGGRIGYIHGGVTHPDGRRGFFKGAERDARESGKAMSPGTRADYSPGQGHRQNVGGPPGITTAPTHIPITPSDYTPDPYRNKPKFPDVSQLGPMLLHKRKIAEKMGPSWLQTDDEYNVGSGLLLADISQPDIDAYLKNPMVEYMDDDTAAETIKMETGNTTLNAGDIKTIKKHREKTKPTGIFAAKGGRVGLLRGGDPNDYPQQEDVSILELQQGEGVPIGPMVQEDRQKQLLKAFAEYQAGGGTLSLKEFAVMWMRENVARGGRINKEGGGVASVLPKGKEMDYRGGGVIPVGSRERADDVPARLSKNEFVMTADAVKAAGGGSVNRGAKKMYNLMHNLEARV